MHEDNNGVAVLVYGTHIWGLRHTYLGTRKAAIGMLLDKVEEEVHKVFGRPQRRALEGQEYSIKELLWCETS
jgi:hypothetical protein